MRLEVGMGASVYINGVSEGVRSVSGWYLDVHLALGVNNPTTMRTAWMMILIWTTSTSMQT